MMLFCKAVFSKLLLSRSNRQPPTQEDTGQELSYTGHRTDWISVFSRGIPQETWLSHGNNVTEKSE